MRSVTVVAFPVSAALVAALLGVCTSCSCNRGDRAKPGPTASSAAVALSASAPLPPKDPPSTPEAVTFETSDKIPLSGTFYPAKDPAAPVLVFVHRFRG